MKKYIVTEHQFNLLRCLFEGVDWTQNQDGSVNLSINQKKKDVDNVGGCKVDTRIFGNREEVLYGDGENNSKSLSNIVLGRRANVVAYANFIAFLKGNWGSNNINTIFTDQNINPKTRTAIRNIYNDIQNGRISVEDGIRSALKNKTKGINANIHKDGLYTKLLNQDAEGKVARYTKFTVPYTNVECIALFSMGSFDLSDAIKNGNLRNSSVLWGNDGLDLSKAPQENEKVPVHYDGSTVRPNISQNFSLNGIPYETNDDGVVQFSGDHYKSQYQLQNNRYSTSVNTADDYNRELSKQKKYTSVNQFLDKSIIYASYALKQEDFKPNYIVSVPSSSKMNEYYSINLANKIGVEYVKDFFTKNIVNAHFSNNVTDEDLLNKGFSPIEIMEMKNTILNYAYHEITYQIEEPLRRLIYGNKEIFSNIKGKEKKYISRQAPKEIEKIVDLDEVLSCLSRHCFTILKPQIESENDVVALHLIRAFEKTKSIQDKYWNLFPIIKNKIDTKVGRRVFGAALKEMLTLFRKFKNEVDKGYKINRYGVGSTKITSISKRYREFIEGSFIVSDKYLNKYQEIETRFKNANILIIDEDVNSGTSFKLAIEALMLKLPETANKNLLCLSNGFSESGF